MDATPRRGRGRRRGIAAVSVATLTPPAQAADESIAVDFDSPGGWVSGKYDRRWNSTRAQLQRTRSLGGEFSLIIHDLWGADGSPISRFPGDNGNWTDWDNFLTRVIADVRATGAPDLAAVGSPDPADGRTPTSRPC